MANSGKKPVERKLEEARAKLFTLESFKEIMKPEFLSKSFDSTFICILTSMILTYFIKTKSNSEAIELFVQRITDNIKEHVGGDDQAAVAQKLFITHPFTHRMVD